MPKKDPVQFHFLVPVTLLNRRGLKAYIASVFKKKKRTLGDLNIIFCNDQYLLELNRRFLNHDYYTDILSFPLSQNHQPLIAEIYISVDRVSENAQASGSSFKEELHRVIFHGVLHFCGYKDKLKKEIKAMRLAEDKHLANYFNSF
jgi:probable rRNA maturation factor